MTWVYLLLLNQNMKLCTRYCTTPVVCLCLVVCLGLTLMLKATNTPLTSDFAFQSKLIEKTIHPSS